MPAGTLWVMGNMKKMRPKWLTGVSMQGYGCSLAVGLGIPIPILNEEIAKYAALKDEDIELIEKGRRFAPSCCFPAKGGPNL